ncbi:hypothetical protein Rmet_6406 [Cupriavidus metallidurans CH34]|uniref:Uncharacterized protein n=1 Tax=Cupriavidus metallidurans (strain ATCC 43123 / DSM 2839 / NBRC 102507 / CH34) TaxID=266264 RepID=D3DXK4_CUPMC|nr:hypothetical protein Rmet_6406 [Cupriavidus metallidurans CH34]
MRAREVPHVMAGRSLQGRRSKRHHQNDLASLRGLAVLLVLSAAVRLARTASLHFDSAS